jgi:hypothetical protein
MKVRAGAPDARFTTIHHMDERGTWATRGRTIFFQPAGEESWRTIARFPPAMPQDLAMPSRLAARVLRLERCSVHPTRSGLMLGIRAGTVYRIDDAGVHPLFRIRGDCVMARAIAESPQGELYFGEYWQNPKRVPARIWRVARDLARFEVARELASPRVRHVHAVHSDPFLPERLWVTMGDFQDECFLGYSDDGFRTAHFLGDGSQLWRAVGLVFQRDRICWMTDTHLVQNHIVSMDRASHQTTLHGERDASSWYQAETTDGLYLATSCVEQGPGIHTDRSRLMASTNGTEWTTLLSYEKDRLPFRLFGFGWLALPAGRFSSRNFWLTGIGLEDLDGACLPCSIEWEAGDRTKGAGTGISTAR